MWIQGSQASFGSQTADWRLSFVYYLLNGSLNEWGIEANQPMVSSIPISTFSTQLEKEEWSKQTSSAAQIYSFGEIITWWICKNILSYFYSLFSYFFQVFAQKPSNLRIQVKWKSTCKYFNVPSGFICNCQKLEVISISFTEEWMNCGTFTQWNATQ